MNENGQSSLFPIVVLFTSSLLALLITKKSLYQYLVIQKNQDIHLCTKQVNGAVTRFTRKVEFTNNLIYIAHKGKHITQFIPGIGLLTKLSIRQSITLLKKVQLKYLFSYLKEIRSISEFKCKPNLSLLKSPYKLKMNFSFSRDKHQRAAKRGKKWHYLISNKAFMTSNVFIFGRKNRIKSRKYQILK